MSEQVELTRELALAIAEMDYFSVNEGRSIDCPEAQIAWSRLLERANQVLREAGDV